MKDNFSDQSDKYALYRPGYPPALFDSIAQLIPDKKLAWDCGTGNGQSAQHLAAFFENVYATDISQKQIDQAPKINNIIYAIEPAEKTALAANSVDLITVSQALHWFDFTLFYNEVKRVGKKDSKIVTWSYGLFSLGSTLDKLIEHYHFKTLETYWDKERQYVNDAYKNLPFLFRRIPFPVFAIELMWNIEMVSGFLNTWSATQKFIKINKFNPVTDLMELIKTHWGDNEMRKVTFPLYILAGAVH